jgi:uracil DNA glycosylase
MHNNAALTVRAGEPNSCKTGWHQFTDAVIARNEKERHCFIMGFFCASETGVD